MSAAAWQARLQRYTLAISIHWLNPRLKYDRARLIAERMVLRAWPHWFDEADRASETARVAEALGCRS